MKTALDLHRDLLTRGVRHEVVRLRGHAAGADDLPTLLSVEPAECVAVRCFRVTDARTHDGAAVHLVAVAVRAGDTPDEAAVAAALDAASIRPATPDEVSAHTGYAASLVSPLGLPEDVVLLADSALADDPSTLRFCATGESGTALAVALRDLLVESGARVASLTPVAVVGSGDWRADGAQVIPLADALSDRRDGRRAGGPTTTPTAVPRTAPRSAPRGAVRTSPRTALHSNPGGTRTVG